MTEVLLIIVAVLFAINMGGSGIAPSFAASVGAKIVSRKRAIFLFGIFVLLGALALGKNVSFTIGKQIIPPEFMNLESALIILISSTVVLFLTNLLGIPISTSEATVGAVTGVGIFFKHVNLHTLFFRIIPFWFILPLFSYLITLTVYRIIYPPSPRNLLLYEKVFINAKKMRFLTLLASCYVAFSIGANNVANAVGPLLGAGILGPFEGLALFSPLFGVGASLVGKKNLSTTGKKVVPMGSVSSFLVSFITATLLVFASYMGIPQCSVNISLCSILAINRLKHNDGCPYGNLQPKIFSIWVVSPLLSMFLSFLMAHLLIL